MATDYAKNPDLYTLFTPDSYIDLVTEFLAILNPSIVMERFINESPPEYLIAPKWNKLKNYHILNKIEAALKVKDLFQGKFF